MVLIFPMPGEYLTATLCHTRTIAYVEARFITVGLFGDTAVAIAHTETENEIRIISMRKADRYKRENYFASL
jgi:uncharacterized DUF497 family protein